MKKRTVLWLIIAIFSIKKLSAQSIITDPIQAAMDTMYSKLDTNFIPYKMLLEKAYLNSKLTYFNGILDSTADFQETITAAEDLRFMYVGKNNPYINLATKIQSDINNYRNGSGGIIPLSILDFMFGGIDSNAFTQNLLKIDGYYIKDVFPRNLNPYVNDRTLIFSPAINSGGYQATFNFILLREHIYRNNSNSNFETNIRINFDDGFGFRTIQFNQPIQISYPSGKRGRKKFILEIEVREGANTIVKRNAYSYFDLEQTVQSFTPPANINDDECPLNQTSFWVTSDLKAKGFNYEAGNKGLVTVVYGIDPATGKQRTCVKKPVFFVEGIDFKNKNQSAEGYDWRFGKCNGLGLVDFITRMEMRDEKYYVMSPDHPFYLVRDMIKELNDKGYDFIYLDFEKGSDYMQKNALVVIKLIQYINGIKSKNGSCEPNIVVGASMGGQVVKYALSMMEYYHLEHDSKLYVSFDSPHLGANIPIGFQLMAKFFTDAERFSGLTIKKAKEESKYSIDHKLSRPATKQLLNYHYESMGEHPERTKFLNELNMFGDFPSETFNFAISNGSGRMGETAFSGLNFAPGDNLFTYEITLQNIIDRQLSFYMPKKYIGKKIKNFFTNVISSPTFLNGVGVIVSALTQTPVVAQITQIITTASSSTRVYASKSGQRVFSFKPFFVSESSALNFYAPNAPEIDHVAGSLRSDISDMAVKVKSELLTYGLSNIVNTYNRKSFCFMPTPSTLAWKASPYHVAINTRMKDYLINMDLSSAPMYSKFGMVLFPDTNEAHVRITNFNKSSFINLLDLNIIKSRLAINEYSLPNIYGSTFNHNQSQGGELFITTLNSGAVYNINKPTAIGAYNYFLNEYTPGKNLNVFNRPCNNVTINSNALMEIYGYSNQFSNLYIVSGTQMVLNTGSKLNLYNNASLVIKSGAKLIINNGSQLALNGGVLIIEEGGILEYKGGSFSLNGASACLNIKGSLLVASGVMFAPVISGGYLLFDGNLVNYQSQVSVLNSKIKLSALNINDLVLKINQPELFLKSNQLIEISRGKIEFAKDQSRLIIDAPTVIKDVILTQSASLLPKKANGLQVNFKSGSGVFSNIKANNLNQAITVTSSSNLKALFNTLFIDNCNYGLVVYNGGIQLLNSNFNSNNNAVILNPITLSSEISGSTFESNGCAINVKGSTSVPIKLSSSKLNGNNFGYFITNGTISALRCNTFTNNEVPVIGKTDAVIDLRYGYNSFINSIDFHNLIVLEKAKDLLLENGYNYFFNQDKGKCLSDNIECKFLISGTITKTTNPCRINALNNAYYNLNSIITSSNYNRLFNVINTTCGQVIFNDVSPVLWPLNCGQYDLVKKLSIDSNLIVFDYHDDCSDVQAWEYSNYLYSDPLACMDLNFNQTLSGDFILEEEELSEIWPNPVKAGESLNFKFNSESKGNITIRVYDLLGKQVVEQRNLGNDGRLIIDQNLTKGLYIIQVSNSRDEFFTKKLLIE